jgi:hypothetical protein
MLDPAIKALVREAWLAHNHPFQANAPVMGEALFRLLNTHPEQWAQFPNGVNLMRGYNEFVRHVPAPPAISFNVEITANKGYIDEIATFDK